MNTNMTAISEQFRLHCERIETFLTNHQTHRWHHCTGGSDCCNPCCTEIYRISNLMSSSKDIPIWNSAAHYYRQYHTGPSQNCPVTVWPRGGHPSETDRRCGVITLVKTLTRNSPQNTHSKHRTYIASVLLVQYLYGVQCNLGCLKSIK
jgi:hypothetical protein